MRRVKVIAWFPAAWLWLAATAMRAESPASSSCASCHEKQARSQPRTSMARALEIPGADSVLGTHPNLTFRDGAYSYRIERRGPESIYTVTGGEHTLSLPIRWAFGANSQTYVLEYAGRFYESRVSYYFGIGALDITMGDQHAQPRTIVEAMGRELSEHEKQTCFECHATGALADDRVQLDTLTPGVKCEHCHSGAAVHQQAVSQGKLQPVPERLGRLLAEDTSQFCGQCHRSWGEVVRNHLFGQINVRFQPYRLANSKCYDGSDRRISCLACHDPHSELVSVDKAYDAKCLACHGTSAASSKAAAKTCTVANTGCVGCHMQKIQLPGSHQSFTDHYIRVVRANEAYPN